MGEMTKAKIGRRKERGNSRKVVVQASPVTIQIIQKVAMIMVNPQTRKVMGIGKARMAKESLTERRFNVSIVKNGAILLMSTNLATKVKEEEMMMKLT